MEITLKLKHTTVTRKPFVFNDKLLRLIKGIRARRDNSIFKRISGNTNNYFKNNVFKMKFILK